MLHTQTRWRSVHVRGVTAGQKIVGNQDWAVGRRAAGSPRAMGRRPPGLRAVGHWGKKGKGNFLLTSVVPSVPTRLLSKEANGAPSTPLPLSVLRFTGIQSYSYTDQRKVEADVEVTEGRTGDLSLRKPRTSQLSHDCSYHALLNYWKLWNLYVISLSSH